MHASLCLRNFLGEEKFSKLLFHYAGKKIYIRKKPHELIKSLLELKDDQFFVLFGGARYKLPQKYIKKLSVSEVEEVRLKFLEGARVSDLARKYGVSRYKIYQICKFSS